MPGTETVLVSIVNEPAPAAPDSNRPQDVASVPNDTVAEANMFPLEIAAPRMDAELPTCHQTLDALAPPDRIILLPTFMVSAATGAWKTQTALALPPALSVRSPVTSIVEPVAEM